MDKASVISDTPVKNIKKNLMVKIKAFAGYRPLAEFATLVASRPYDVMNRKEAKEEAKDNQYSFLHIIRSEIDLPDSLDEHDMKVYEKARDNFSE